MRNHPPIIIPIEGLDGCGKTTQLKLLHNYLKQEGQNVRTIRLPGVLKRHVIGVLKPLHQLHIFLADQVLFLEHLAHLPETDYILVDRWTTSSHVYQPHDRAISRALHESFPTPNLLIYLDCPPATCLKYSLRRRSPSQFDKSSLQEYTKRRERYLHELEAMRHPTTIIHPQSSQQTHEYILQCLQKHQLLPCLPVH